MIVPGINASHGDAEAALIKDGRIIAAVEEERFNRVKHYAGFPAEAVRCCLRAAGITIEDVAHIGISRDPSANLHMKIFFAASRAAKQVAGTRRLRAFCWQRSKGPRNNPNLAGFGGNAKSAT